MDALSSNLTYSLFFDPFRATVRTHIDGTHADARDLVIFQRVLGVLKVIAFLDQAIKFQEMLITEKNGEHSHGESLTEILRVIAIVLHWLFNHIRARMGSIPQRVMTPARIDPLHLYSGGTT